MRALNQTSVRMAPPWRLSWPNRDCRDYCNVDSDYCNAFGVKEEHECAENKSSAWFQGKLAIVDQAGSSMAIVEFDVPQDWYTRCLQSSSSIVPNRPRIELLGACVDSRFVWGATWNDPDWIKSVRRWVDKGHYMLVHWANCRTKATTASKNHWLGLTSVSKSINIFIVLKINCNTPWFYSVLFIRMGFWYSYSFLRLQKAVLLFKGPYILNCPRFNTSDKTEGLTLCVGAICSQESLGPQPRSTSQNYKHWLLVSSFFML